MGNEEGEPTTSPVSADIAGWLLARFIQTLIRASLGDGNPNKTTTGFLEFADAFRATRNASVGDVMQSAIEEMALRTPSADPLTRAETDLTRSTVQCYLESTCDDPAARARASTKWQHVLDDIACLERTRQNSARPVQFR